jgi:hypothetical protein
MWPDQLRTASATSLQHDILLVMVRKQAQSVPSMQFTNIQTVKRATEEPKEQELIEG